MAAREVQRTYDSARCVIDIVVEDDFGVRSKLEVHIGRESCPCCGRPYPTDSLKDPNIPALLDEHTALRDQLTDHRIRVFEKNGADMATQKASRALPPSNNPAGH